MSLLSISPTLGSRRSMAPDGYFRRSTPTKPFLLRGDRMRSVTVAAPPQRIESFNTVSNEPLTLYDMRKMTSQNVVRRRIVSMGEHLSPRGSRVAFDEGYEQAAVRRTSQMVLDALYDSSPDSSPPCTPNDVYGKKQDAWQFPLPPASMSASHSKSKGPPALDLCHDILPGLGFEGLESFTFAESAVEVGSPVSPPAQNTPQSFNGQYDSDTAPSSHWSPSTCAPSICESQDGGEDEVSFTEPLAIRKPSGRQSVMADDGEGLRQYEEEQEDYLRPFPAMAEGDEAKLDRLRSSYSLLGMMSDAYTKQEQGVEQSEQSDEEHGSPTEEINLRLILSPEHAAPSLAEQLAFACGNGYQYHDRSHRDSAGEYLMARSLSPLVMTPAQFGCLDPFNGLQAECGDSWSELDHDTRTLGSTAAGGLQRGPSTRSAHRRMSVISNTSPILSGHMAAVAFMNRSKSHVGHFEPSSSASLEVPTSSEKQTLNKSLLLSPLSGQRVNTTAPAFAHSPAPQNLEEFSYLALMDPDEAVESPPQMEMSESPLDTPEVVDEASSLATAEVASLRASSTRMSSTASMGDFLSPTFSETSSAFPASVTCSQMTRSSTSTSILDRGRPVRPSSGTGFLGQREEKIQIIKLKTGLSSAAAAKLADGPPARPPRPARTFSGNYNAVATTSAAESVKKEWVEKNSPVTPPTAAARPCKTPTAVTMAKQDSRAPSVHFHIPSSSTIQIAKHIRVVSSSTSRGVPMTMTRSTSRPGTFDFQPTDPATAPPAGVKRLSAQAAAALKEAKLEAEQAAAAAAVHKAKLAARPAMPGGTQSADEVRRSSKESSSKSSLETSKPFQAPPMPERSASAPPPLPASASAGSPTRVAPSPPRPARPLKAADRLGRGLPTSHSLPTLFTARTVSQRFRGETGLPETQATLAAAGAAARANRKSSSPLGRLLTESGVKVAAAAGAGMRPRRWGIVKALSPEERRNSAVGLDTPSGCVLILEEETVLKEVAAPA